MTGHTRENLILLGGCMTVLGVMGAMWGVVFAAGAVLGFVPVRLAAVIVTASMIVLVGGLGLMRLERRHP